MGKPVHRPITCTGQYPHSHNQDTSRTLSLRSFHNVCIRISRCQQASETVSLPAAEMSSLWVDDFSASGTLCPGFLPLLIGFRTGSGCAVKVSLHCRTGKRRDASVPEQPYEFITFLESRGEGDWERVTEGLKHCPLPRLENGNPQISQATTVKVKRHNFPRNKPGRLRTEHPCFRQWIESFL